jgi:hypothetical protein
MSTIHVNQKNPPAGDSHLCSTNMTNLWDAGPAWCLDSHLVQKLFSYDKRLFSYI